MSRLAAKSAFSAAALWLLACDSPRAAPPSPKASAPPAYAATAKPPTHGANDAPREVPAPQEAPNTCRVLAVTGKVDSRLGPLVPQASLDGTGFIDLAAGANLVAKHARSGRELTVEGPGRAVICPGGEEQVLLAAGRFKTLLGPGARPGAEVWVATAAGVVRYGDATLSVRADAKQVEVAVDAGDAWVESARGATLNGPERVQAKQRARLSRGADSKAPALTTACEKAGEAAASAARQVLGTQPAGSDAGTLGERAAAQVRARRAARSACASAAAALGEVKNPEEYERLTLRIQLADRLWKLVPTPKPSGAPP